jgi:myxalamid-type polyketide synthase MxaE and MxaD
MDALGSRLTIIEGDAASSAAMERTFALFGSECHPLRGVFHAATVQSLAGITELSDQQLLEMLRPKVIGTCMLHEWTKNCDLDFFVAFSSTTSILGSSNMAHYAAANQFLDSFARVRHSQNLPMLSINWGAWEQDTADPGFAQLEQMGLLPMEPSLALQSLARLLHSSQSNIMIANVDWKTLKSVYEARRVRPILSDLEYSATTAKPAFIPLSESPVAAQDREISVTESVASAAASVLGFRNGDTPPIDVPLTDLGLDSLMAVDLRNRLQTEFRRELPSTIVFDYPTISGLSAILESMIWVTEGKAFSDANSPHDEIRI